MHALQVDPNPQQDLYVFTSCARTAQILTQWQAIMHLPDFNLDRPQAQHNFDVLNTIVLLMLHRPGRVAM
ncbi:hypothetical protein H4R35_004275, partial [Dimargaris xerosporica]